MPFKCAELFIEVQGEDAAFKEKLERLSGVKMLKLDGNRKTRRTKKAKARRSK